MGPKGVRVKGPKIIKGARGPTRSFGTVTYISCVNVKMPYSNSK